MSAYRQMTKDLAREMEIAQEAYKKSLDDDCATLIGGHFKSPDGLSIVKVLVIDNGSMMLGPMARGVFVNSGTANVNAGSVATEGCLPCHGILERYSWIEKSEFDQAFNQRVQKLKDIAQVQGE